MLAIFSEDGNDNHNAYSLTAILQSSVRKPILHGLQFLNIVFLHMNLEEDHSLVDQYM